MLINRQKLISIRDIFLRDVGSFGSSFVHIIATIFLILNPYTFFLGSLIFLNLIFSLATSYSIRMIYFKERPMSRTHSTFLEKLDASSFPSTHTLKMFSVSTIISLYLGNIYIAVFSYIISITVGYSRIHFKHHRMIDVVVGAILGVIVGYLVFFLYTGK